MTNQSERPFSFYLYCSALIAAVGGFLFGFDLAIINGAIVFLAPDLGLSAAQKGWAVSSAILGCTAGPVLSTWLTDRYGRKRTLWVAALCYIVSAIGSASASGLWDFALWRMLGGVGVGLSSLVSPMYIAEIAPARLRGRLVILNQLSIVIGIGLAVLVSYYFSFSENWRAMFLSECAPILLLMGGLMVVPESPRWLALVGKKEAARRVLQRINGPNEGDAELGRIMADLKIEEGGWRELFSKGVRTAFWVGAVIMIFQQINGVNMMLTYTATILMEAGIADASDAILNSLYANGAILLGTIISFRLVSRYGRREILVYGVSAMLLSHVLFGLSFIFDLNPWWTIAILLLAVLSFTLSLAPLGWVVLSEIFPNRIRNKGMSMVCVCLWISAFLCAQAFPMLTALSTKWTGTPGYTWFVFAGVCAVCVIFVSRYLPETKDLTLEEIGEFWLKRNGASKDVN